MSALFRDIRFAGAALLRSPGTTVVIIATLALGIGANCAIFSLYNVLVLRPLPIPHPEELVSLMTTIGDNVNGDEPLSLPMFQELGRNQKALTDLFASNIGNMNNLEIDGAHSVASVANVSGDYYKAMLIVPLLGRFITRTDVARDSGTSSAVAVISYRIWQAGFHGDPNAIGKTLRLGDRSFTVIGVEPEGFSGLIIDGSCDITIPILSPGTYSNRDPKILWLEIRGRLRPGLSLPQAQAQLQTLWPSIQKLTIPPGYDGSRSLRFFARKLKVESAWRGVSYLRTRFSHPLTILLVLVASLLLIACLNLANLSIAKMASQQHAWSVKLALGAGPWDLVRPILVESFIASAVGALVGLAIAYSVTPLLLNIAWTGLVATPLSASPDVRVLLFTAAITMLTGLLFAMVPAWYAIRAEALTGLRQNTRSVHGSSSHLGHALLTAQVALSLIMVAGAMLFAKTLASLHTVDTGYRRDHLLTMMLFPQSGHGKLSNRSAYYRDLAEKIRSLPGVSGVSYSGGAPGNEFEAKGPMFRSPDSTPIQAIDEVIGPEFFSTLGMHVLSGREFTWSDDEHSPLVAVVSKKFAETLYGGENPVGRDFYFGVSAAQKKLRIIGVVPNASLWKVESVEPMAVYRPQLQNEYDEPLLDIRTNVEPGTLKAAAERTVRSLGHHFSLRTATLDERLDGRLSAQRLTALLSAFFGVVALLIAAIGLYGLMSFHMMQRTTELAVRLALGAQSRQVFSIVIREVLTIAAIGCSVGVVAAVSLRSYVASLIFGVSASDPLLLSLAVFILAAVALLAGFLPACRAATVDPAVALRKD